MQTAEPLYEHLIVPHRPHRVYHGSLTPEQVAAVNRLPGQLRQPFLATAERERQRYWKLAREALLAHGRRRTHQECDDYVRAAAALERRRAAVYTSDIDTVCHLYRQLKRQVIEGIARGQLHMLQLAVCRTRCDALDAWAELHPFQAMTLRALQCELQQSGWVSHYDLAPAPSDNDANADGNNNRIYFWCNLSDYGVDNDHQSPR